MRHHPATSAAAAPAAAAPAATVAAPRLPPAARARAALTRLGRRLDWPIILVALAALALNLYRLGAPSIWADEAFSVELARLPVHTIWGAFTSNEPNMILYYLVLHVWLFALNALGIPFTEFAVRLPSALFAAASAVMALVIGRQFVSRAAGLVGAGLYILSGWQLTYAQQARGYSLQLLLVGIAWYALFAALRDARGRWPWWVVYAGASVLAVYTQAFTLLVILAQVVVFACLWLLPTVWRTQTRRRLPAMLLSLLGIGALSIPLILASRHSNTPGWLPSPQVGEILRKLAASGTTRGLTIVLVALCVVVGGALWAATRLPLAKRLLGRVGLDPSRALILPAAAAPTVVGLVGWMLVPAATSFLVSQGALRLFSSRYLVVIVPALCLLAGTILASLSWKWVRLASVVIVIGASLALLPGYYASAQIEDWRSAVHWIEARHQPGDGLISFDNVQEAQTAIQFELHADRAPFDFTPDTPGYISLARYGAGDPYAEFGQAINPYGISVYAAHHARLFYVLARVGSAGDAAAAQQTRAWLDGHYHLIGQFSDGVATVLLYDTGATS